MIVAITNPYRFAPKTLVVSPQAGSSGTTCDGHVARINVDETFASIRAGSGNNNNEFETQVSLFLQASVTSNQYQAMRRLGLSFDTSTIPTSATVLSVTLKLHGTNKVANLGQTDIVVCAFAPNNPGDFVNSDYNLSRWPSTQYARMSYSAWNDNGYNVFTLPTTAINKGGITAIGLRLGWDFDNNTTGLVWLINALTSFVFYTADNGTNIPILEVEWQE